MTPINKIHLNCKSIRNFALIFLIGFVSSIFCAFLRSEHVQIGKLGGFNISALAGFIIMFGIIVFLLRKYKNLKPRYVLLTLWLGISCLELPTHIFEYNATRVSLPTYVMWCLGVVAGYLLFFAFTRRFSKRKRIFLSAICGVIACFVVWGSTNGYDLWLHYLNNGTFIGKLAPKSAPEFTMSYADGKETNIGAFKGTFLVLDFWHSHCGVCFDKFPEVQAVYDKYAQSDKVAFYAVHCRIEKDNETCATGSEILHERGYSFPCLSIDIKDQAKTAMGITSVPTVIIIDPEGQMIFRGNIVRAAKYLDELIAR